MKGNEVIIVKNTEGNNHFFRSNYIIKQDSMYYFAEFRTQQQFENFLNTIGCKFILDKVKNKNTFNEIKFGHLDYFIQDYFTGGFWKLSELPKNSQKIKGLSNGSIVDCYFYKDKKNKKIIWYRPNPNAKDIYKPLEINEHIAHKMLYGCY